MLLEGKNSWRIARAERVAFLVDADAYFGAFRRAVSRARDRVIMVGWDIDSRVVASVSRTDPARTPPPRGELRRPSWEDRNPFEGSETSENGGGA